MSRPLRYKTRAAPESPLVKLPELPHLGLERSVIRVAIVCGRETKAVANLIETLLADTKIFICTPFEFHPMCGIKPSGHEHPDVVIVILAESSANNPEFFFASLRRAFPHRPVLVTTTHPDAFDAFKMLEM